ncbi:hypothetical protein F2Q69_00024816 [Brassica cretica]|uniref:Uncharacterized protein n=1 Tax=Brassica cretica TaxID=69181 RepID=A0A8S9QPT1_BRACR|nr:hypothetical protein F2Q69_00024816 [Brassica cretica]
MGYEDFVYFILAEEDKSSVPSLEYWRVSTLTEWDRFARREYIRLSMNGTMEVVRLGMSRWRLPYEFIKVPSGSGQLTDRTMKLTLSSYRQITHGLTRSAEKKRRMKAKKARIGIIVLLNLVPRVPVPIKNRNNN